jgi:hypothetical protein
MDLNRFHLRLTRLASSKWALAWMAVFGWLIGFGGIAGLHVIGAISAQAPTVADAAHQYAHRYKGQIRFLTGREDRVGTAAGIMMFAGAAIFATAIAARVRLYRREEDDRVKRVLRGGSEETG